MDFFSLHKYTILELLGVGGGLDFLRALVCKIGRKKILKPKKVFKRHHNTAAVISQLDMKTNKCIYYWDYWGSKKIQWPENILYILAVVWVPANEIYLRLSEKIQNFIFSSIFLLDIIFYTY